MRGAFQKRWTRERCIGVLEIEMAGELVGEPADLAAAHRVRLAGDRERPGARTGDAAGGEMAVDDGVDLVGAGDRLVDALRVDGDDAIRSGEPVVERPSASRDTPAMRATALGIEAACLGERCVASRVVWRAT